MARVLILCQKVPIFSPFPVLTQTQEESFWGRHSRPFSMPNVLGLGLDA